MTVFQSAFKCGFYLLVIALATCNPAYSEDALEKVEEPKKEHAKEQVGENTKEHAEKQTIDQAKKQAKEQIDNQVKAEYARAHELVEKKDFKGAVEILEQQAKRFPDRLETLLSLAAVLEMADQLDRAEEVLQKCVQIEKSTKQPNFDIHLLLGKLYLHRGNWVKALSEFDEAEKVNPKEIYPYKRSAMLLLSTQDPMLSYYGLRHLSSAIKLAPDDPELKLYNGLGKITIGERTEGLEQLMQAHKSGFLNLEKDIAGYKKDFANEKPAPTALEKRTYNPSGMAAVVISTRDNGRILKMAFLGGKDPDDGKQDGINDGIIEFLRDNVSIPDKVYRQKIDQGEKSKSAD